MARTPREFTVSNELKNVAEQLLDRYRDSLNLTEVNLDDIYFAFCTSPKPGNSDAHIITSVSHPLPRRVTERAYQIAFYKDAWDSWTEARKNAMMLWALYHVDASADEGKLRKKDVQDYYRFVSTWGPNWQQRDDLPDVLGVKGVAFDLPIPIDEDTGETVSSGTVAPLPKEPTIAAVVVNLEAAKAATEPKF